MTKGSYLAYVDLLIEDARGIAVGETTVGLLSACSRLIELLETPEDILFLSHLIQREIVNRILWTPQGENASAPS